MSTAEVYGQEDLERPEAKPWTPRVIRGGKGPPEAPTDNWLVKLPLGTTFVAQPVGSDVEMNLYHIDYSSDEVVLLTWRLPDGKMIDIYVNPTGFCKKHRNWKVLGTEPAAQEEEPENGNECNRADRPSSLVLHEAVSGEHQVLPEEE